MTIGGRAYIAEQEWLEDGKYCECGFDQGYIKGAKDYIDLAWKFMVKEFPSLDSYKDKFYKEMNGEGESNIKQDLKEKYMQFYCELGIEHPDTKTAKKLYDTYCIAQKETADKAWEWIAQGGHTYDALKEQFYKAIEGGDE